MTSSPRTNMRATLQRTAFAAAVLTAGCASAGKGAARDASLYARLGGYEAIAAVTDDILKREIADAAIAPFFKGLDEKDMKRIRQHLVDLLCAATGGPCFYPGKEMKATHAELEITENTWNIFTGHIGETLAAFKVGDRERNELVVIVGSLKKDIVNKP